MEELKFLEPQAAARDLRCSTIAEDYSKRYAGSKTLEHLSGVELKVDLAVTF